ncbi:hypothetical protein QTP88_010250 [Uroleucon formosanum]
MELKDEEEDNVEILQKDHNTDTEQSDISDEENSELAEYNFVDNAITNDDNYHESDDELPLSMRRLPYYVGKDGTRWNKRAYYKPKLQVGEQRVRASGRCQFYDRQRDRKTTKVCTNCAKLICRDHLVEVCPECFNGSDVASVGGTDTNLLLLLNNCENKSPKRL